MNPLNVLLFEPSGPHLAAKMTLRCRKHENQIRYRVDCYGNDTGNVFFLSVNSNETIYSTIYSIHKYCNCELYIKLKLI